MAALFFRRPVGRRLSSVLALIFLGLGLLSGLGPGATRVWAADLSAYGALPSLDHPVLSPSGQRLAYIASSPTGRRLVVATLPERQVVASAPADSAKVRSLVFADEDHVVVMISTAMIAEHLTTPFGEWSQALSFNVKTSTFSPLMNHRVLGLGPIMNIITGAPMVRRIKGETWIYLGGVHYDMSSGVNPAIHGLFRTSPDGLRTESVDRGDVNALGWLVSADGGTIVRETLDPRAHAYSLGLVANGHELRTIWRGEALIDRPAVLGFDAKGERILLSRRLDGGRDGLQSLPLRPDAVPEEVSERRWIGAATSSSTGSVIYGEPAGWNAPPDFVDPALSARWAAILNAFPAPTRVTPADVSDDGLTFLVRLEGGEFGFSYERVDLRTGKAAFLGDGYAGVGPDDIAQKQRVTYRAADGLEIPAYLTLPRGKAPHGLALIVLPHGGPEAADPKGFDWWAQALASQGYAVLQPQFRGSAGASPGYTVAGYGEFGRKMQTDPSDGAAWAVKAGYADAKRICIVGGSYGGYAALAGATLQPETWRCAASIAGIADVRAFLVLAHQSGRGGDSQAFRYWDRFMGATSEKDPALSQINPIEHAGAVSAPLLLIHGKDDIVVDYSQSARMDETLRRLGKDVRFVTLHDEDHWLSRASTRTQMLTELVSFLRTANPPG